MWHLWENPEWNRSMEGGRHHGVWLNLIYGNQIPYTYKFTKYVNFADNKNPAFSRFYFRGSPVNFRGEYPASYPAIHFRVRPLWLPHGQRSEMVRGTWPTTSLAWPDPFSAGRLSIRDYKLPLRKGLVNCLYLFRSGNRVLIKVGTERNGMKRGRPLT